MKGKGTKAAAVFAALALTGLPVCAQDEERSLVDLFYTYTQDNVVVSYEEGNYLEPSGDLEYRLYDGFLTLSQTDLNWDGAEELLAVRLKPQTGESGQQENALVAEVYQRQENTLRRKAQYTLAEGFLDRTGADIDVFALNGQDGQILVCECKDTETLLSDGVEWTLRAVGFDGTDFYEVKKLTLTGSFFEDEYMDKVYAAANDLGLWPSDPVWTPLADQTEVGILCSIDRQITDYDGAAALLNGGSAESVQYGTTSFTNYVNSARENKLSKAFSAVPGADGQAAQNQAGAAEGGQPNAANGDSQPNAANGDSQSNAANGDSQPNAANGDSQSNAANVDSRPNAAQGDSQTGAAQGSGQQAGAYHYAQDYVIPDSGSRYLTEEDLAGLTEEEIFLARNEIYARHGYIFNDAALSDYFNSKSWYQPTISGEEFTEEYAAQVFNDCEIANISAMVQYEEEHGLNIVD